MSTIKIIDRTALKFNQFCIVFLIAVAFIFNIAWLTGIVAVILFVGAIFPKAGLFKIFCKKIAVY